MTFTAYQLWWCVGQITLLAILASVATGIWLRRRPAAGARVATAATAMILAVTFLALIPIPQWTFSQSPARDAAQTAPAAAAIPTSNSTLTTNSPPAAPAFSAIDLYNSFAGSVRATVEYPASHGKSRWFGALVVVCTALGLARLTWALTYLQRIRQQSTPIVSQRLARLANRLATNLEVTQPIELRECASLLSPAVIGWRRPTILIPSAWPSWSADQLQAALAHELAHVSRGDSLTRLLAACATTLHFYHPFVHWLAARLALSQELAADRLAAAATGDERRYLRAISELAIWLDEQPGLRAEPLVLPTFSSNLIRRIKMLRAMDCTYDNDRSHRRTAVAVALLALIALTTTALRGNAEDTTPSLEQPQSTPNSTTSTTTPSSTASANSFRRPPLDFSTIGDNKLGAYVIRVSDIVEQPALRTFLETQVLPTKEQFEKHWADEFGPEVPPPALDLSAIDYIAGVGNLTIRPIPPDQVTTPGTTDTTMLGTPEAIVRFKQPVAWKAWIHRHFPASIEKSVAGVTYVELPVIKAFGPKPLYAIPRDPHTIVLLVGMGPDSPGPDEITAAANPAPRPAKSQLAARWAELDGGLITVIATDHNVTPSEPTTPEKVLTKQILDATQLYGCACDVDAQTGQAIFRMQLTCDSPAAAREVQGPVEAAIALAQAAATTSATPPASPSAPLAIKDQHQPSQAQDIDRFQSEFNSNAAVSLWQQPDGAAGILVETTATIPGYAPTAATAARDKTSPK